MGRASQEVGHVVARNPLLELKEKRLSEPTKRYKVLCRFEHVGFHCWPKAPDLLAYLRNDHRHLFKFVVELEAEHADRAIEIHQLKACCESWAARMFVGAKTWSCEQFANLLLASLHRDFQPLSGRVECWEDGECGGVCEMTWREEEK